MIFWNLLEQYDFIFLNLPLHCGYNQPGYLLPLNKQTASAAYFSPMEKPVGAVWLSLVFLEEWEASQAPTRDDAL